MKQRYLFLAGLSLLLSACLAVTRFVNPGEDFPTPTPAAAATATAAHTAVDAAIQESVDIFVEAQRSGDADLLATVVDPENAAFRRFVLTRFNEQQQSMHGGQNYPRLIVMSTEQLEHGFVLAHVESSGGSAADWVFRQVDGRWLLSEPSVSQIGEAVLVETEYFTFKTYPWSEQINTRIEALMASARQRVEQVLGQAPAEKAEVEIVPIYGLYPFDSPGAVAYYSGSGSDSVPDRIVIYSPGSIMFGFYDAAAGWEQDLLVILTHEYTHMAHDRVFNKTGRIAYWVSEGLAEYVAGSDRSWLIADALAADALIPLVDTRPGVVYKQDLAHIYTLEQDRDLAYAESQSVVAFIVAKYGGLEGFWRLCAALDQHGELEDALQEAFGVSTDEFDRQWRDWLMKEYLD